jgi:hypothetical protein
VTSLYAGEHHRREGRAAYDATLFVSQLLQGNIINAIGYAIAADVGLATVAAIVKFIVIASAIVSNIQDIARLIP